MEVNKRPYSRRRDATPRDMRNEKIMASFFTGHYNIEELAALHGVSYATVSRVIEQHFKQKAAKRDRERSTND